jgi:hypothetical protein
MSTDRDLQRRARAFQKENDVPYMRALREVRRAETAPVALDRPRIDDRAANERRSSFTEWPLPIDELNRAFATEGRDDELWFVVTTSHPDYPDADADRLCQTWDEANSRIHWGEGDDHSTVLQVDAVRIVAGMDPHSNWPAANRLPLARRVPAMPRGAAETFNGTDSLFELVKTGAPQWALIAEFEVALETLNVAPF